MPTFLNSKALSRYLYISLLGSLSLCALVGCAASARVSPVSNTFLEGVDATHKIENLPFDHAWVRDDFDGRKYNKYYLKQIRTDLLPKESFEHSASAFIPSEEEYKKEAQMIAEYFHAQLVESINKYPENRIQLVDQTGGDVVTVEIALTELEFSHPVARIGALAVPVPGTGAALSTITDPHVAFAARISDPSGQLAATIADRKFPPMRLLDVNKMTVTSSPREICAIWAKTIAEAGNKGRFAATEREGQFSILPW